MKTERLRLTVRGAVQGVGFRPFVYRLARELELAGWVRNFGGGVLIEVEGLRELLDRFLDELKSGAPPRAVVHSLEPVFLDATGRVGFEIQPSTAAGAKSALIMPDIATCADCLREVLDPANRRYRYPFTNCTNCGPRFSIIEALPYDRVHTTMRQFVMCPACEREYHDPGDRRFHAQPNACPVCGPHLEWWDAAGVTQARDDAALRAAAAALREGRIVALKGLGGFQLLVQAGLGEAVNRLRERKVREEKPFALLYPSLEAVCRDCEVTEQEQRVLLSPEAPIVLLRRAAGATRVAEAVAPGNPTLGVMLPYTPLHHLLMRELDFPVVATSGNRSDEPICIDEHEALERLGGIADAFLVHNRPIARHVDDSVVRVVLDREMVLRRARGYAPLPVPAGGLVGRQEEDATPSPVLAVGAHLKNTVALRVAGEVFLSQHIGDLDTPVAQAAFQRVVADLPRLYEVTPAVVVCDLHPDYFPTRQAEQMTARPLRMQHHWAHVLSCMADNEVAPPALGVAWDGTGFGTDGTIWGGEFLLASGTGFRRAGHLRLFRLPGGEAAVREPRRSALGLLFALWGRAVFERTDLAPVQAFTPAERAVLAGMLERGINAPWTSSAGRLFDAVAAVLGLRQRSAFEGQAAMALEFAAEAEVGVAYPFAVRDGMPRIVDWQPCIEALVEDVRRGTAAGVVAAKFHNTLAEMVVAVACEVGQGKVLLTGGCFQNRLLLERCVARLQAAGLHPYWHQRVPPNDGGIAVGQAVGAWDAGGTDTGPLCVGREIRAENRRGSAPPAHG